jgi:RNA polymerase sigma-70 factor (ECF subfamily)
MALEIGMIFEEFDGRLRRFVSRRVSDPMAAEDILQEVYLRIHSRLHTLQDESRLQAWLYQIARNAVIDYYRREKPTSELDEAASLAEDTDEKDATQELAEGLGDLIAGLPEKYRTALVLSELEGVPQHEVARQLGISVSGAKSRVQRARGKLKQALLDCCHLEFDRLGKILDYQPNCCCCARVASQAQPD